MRVCVGVEQWAQGQMELKTHLCRGVTCSQIKKTSIQCIRSGKKRCSTEWVDGKREASRFFCTSVSTIHCIVTGTIWINVQVSEFSVTFMNVIIRNYKLADFIVMHCEVS